MPPLPPPPSAAAATAAAAMQGLNGKSNSSIHHSVNIIIRYHYQITDFGKKKDTYYYGFYYREEGERESGHIMRPLTFSRSDRGGPYRYFYFPHHKDMDITLLLE